MSDIKVYITEWKNLNLSDLPVEWRVYHYSPNCPSLIKNDTRSCLRIVEMDENALEKFGFRSCNHTHCIVHGFDVGAFTEGGIEGYIPDEEDFRLMGIKGSGMDGL